MEISKKTMSITLLVISGLLIAYMVLLGVKTPDASASGKGPGIKGPGIKGSNGEGSIDEGASDHKITICHKGHVAITVDRNAWPAHQRHGDTVGACTTDIEPTDIEPTDIEPTDLAIAEGPLGEAVTVTGTLAATPSGDVALRTKDGKGDHKILPLVAQTKIHEKRLEKLAASKLGKVTVTGVKVNDKAKGAKANKGQERKEALKVMSVKKTNKE